MITRERIELNLIDDNPWQPRAEIEPTTLQKLADSIRGVGLLQAPAGRRTPEGRVQLAFGHRRVAAVKLLRTGVEWPDYIDMDVNDELTDEDMAVMALAENVARRQLTQIEVVRAHRRAIDETGLSIQGLADKLGVSRSALSNNLRVLELPNFILEHIERGALRVTDAREFLVLQNATHVHVEDMREVVRRIVNEAEWGNRAPNWRRRNIRKLISERVSFQENNGFRPIGPKTGHVVGGGHREPTFDVDAFAFEFPDSLHTIPADDGSTKNYRMEERYDQSRVWTCEVKEWSRRQSRATREANKAAEASGKGKGHSSSPDVGKKAERDRLLGQLLAKDPVWQDVIAHRKKKGPNRPQTDEEREALGTRAELHVIGYDVPFYKVLDRWEIDEHYQLRQVEGLKGGGVPPWFPDLKECQRCIIGAAYAASDHGYPIRKPVLACFNQEHYLEKLEAGKAAYAEKLAAQAKGIEREDILAIEDLRWALTSGTIVAKYPLALALLTATPDMPGWHPLGFHDDDFCFDTVSWRTAKMVLGITGPYNQATAIEYLEQVDGTDDLTLLTAALMVHHLRQAGKFDGVSWETVASRPDALEVREMLTGEPAAAEAHP